MNRIVGTPIPSSACEGAWSNLLMGGSFDLSPIGVYLEPYASTMNAVKPSAHRSSLYQTVTLVYRLLDQRSSMIGDCRYTYVIDLDSHDSWQALRIIGDMNGPCLVGVLASEAVVPATIDPTVTTDPMAIASILKAIH